MKTKQRLWSKYFIILCVIAVCMNVVMTMLDNTLAIFAKDMYDSERVGGQMTSFFTLGSILTSIFVGRLTDKKGRRIVLLVGAVLFVVPTVLCVFTSDKYVVLAVRFVQGVGRMAASIAAGAMAADIIPLDRMVEGLGYYNMGMTVSFAFGPMLGLMLISGKTYGLLFGACAVLYVMVFALGLFVTYEKNPAYARKTEDSQADADEEKYVKRGGLWKFFEPCAMPSTWVMFFYSASTTGILVYITLFGQQILGFNDGQLSVFFLVSAAAMLLVRLLAGKLMDRTGAMLTGVPSLIMNVLCYVLLAYARSYSAFLVVAVLYGISMAVLFPVLNAVAIQDSPKSRKGAATSTQFFGMDFGVMLMAMLLGVIVEADKAEVPVMGYRYMFLVCAALGAIALALSFVFLTNKTRRKKRLATLGHE